MLPKLLSSDSHVVEPPELWTSRLSSDFQEWGPQVRRVEATPGLRSESGEADYWFIGDRQIASVFSALSHPGRRFEVEDPRDLPLEGMIDDMEGCLDAFSPARYVEDNLRDHVVGQVLYPTIGFLLFGTSDGALLSACCRAYNDFIAEFCTEDPRRLKGVAMINVDDPSEAVEEMSRARSLGLAGAMLPVAPLPEHSYSSDEYNPVWAAAADLEMPVSFHIGTNRVSLAANGSTAGISASVLVNADYFVRMAISDLILSGVFERHPQLKLVSVEHELGWVPFFLERLDYNYTQRAHRLTWHRFKSDALPSDFWRSNCLASFQEDTTITSDQWNRVGVETFAFGSDYPHIETTFPRSTEILDTLLSGMGPDEQHRVAFANTQRVYSFDVD